MDSAQIVTDHRWPKYTSGLRFFSWECYCNSQKKKTMERILKVNRKWIDIVNCVNSAPVIQNEKSLALWFNLSFAPLETIQHQLLRKLKVLSLCSFSALCCLRASKSLLTSMSLCSPQKLVSFFSFFIFGICVKLLRLPHIKLYKSLCDLNIWLVHLKIKLRFLLFLWIYPRKLANPLSQALGIVLPSLD